MRTVLTATMLALGISAASAFDGSQAAGCFNFLPSDVGSGAEAEISVKLDAVGMPTAIEVLRYTPDSDTGRRLAMAAAKAVEACGPYLDGGAGGVITMGPDVEYPDAPGPLITLPESGSQ